jgi:hypothetical protein
VRNQVSHPCKTTGNTTLLYTLIYILVQDIFVSCFLCFLTTTFTSRTAGIVLSHLVLSYVLPPYMLVHFWKQWHLLCINSKIKFVIILVMRC